MEILDEKKEIVPSTLNSEENTIILKLKKRFPKHIINSYYSIENPDELTVILTKEDLLLVANYLKDEPELDFDYLKDICGVHYPENEWSFEVVYHLYSINKKHWLRFKVQTKESETIDSVSTVWKTADWFEREAYDLLGIRFNNHPNLKRILLPTGWEGYPLRKDYPLEGKGDEDNLIYSDFYN